MTTNYGERMARLEEKTDNIEKKVDEVLKRLDNLDQSYAAKWVQTVVGGLISAILLAVIGALLAIVLNQ